MHFLYTALALLLPLAAANDHHSCECWSWSQEQGWHKDLGLSRYTCVLNFNGDASWDTGYNRCISFGHHDIDGDRWEGDCKANGVNGYYPVDDDNAIEGAAPKIYTGDAVFGRCPT